MLRACLRFCVLILADIERSCLPERTCHRFGGMRDESKNRGGMRDENI